MKPLYLACPVARGPGGIAGYARALLAALGPDPVDVLSLGAEAPLFALPAHARFLGSPRSQARFAARLAKDWLTRPPTTFVFAHLGLTRPLAALPSRGHRSVVLLHGIEAWSPLPLRRALGLSRVDVFAFTTVFTRELFLSANEGRLRRDALTPVIPLSAAPELEALPPPPMPAGPRRRIVCVTRLTAEERLKGVATLLEAAALLDGARYELVIVGEGPGRARYEARAAELGVKDRVRFTGWIPDAERTRFIGEADVLCLPSAQEGFGIVFLEAMVAGRPCVGAAAGAVPEVLDPVVGELFPFGDARRLAAALERTCDRFRSGALSPGEIRRFYDERYAYRLFAERWRQLLQEGRS